MAARWLWSDRFAEALARMSRRRWFLPAAAAVPAADFLLPALPAQFTLALAATLRPARPLLIAALFALSAGLGAATAASAVQALGLTAGELAEWGLVSAERAREGAQLARAHGFTALLLLALLPLPPRAATLLTATAGVSPLAIGAAVALGRTVPSSCLALAAVRAPGVLGRFRPMRRLAERLARLQSEAANAGRSAGIAKSVRPRSRGSRQGGEPNGTAARSDSSWTGSDGVRGMQCGPDHSHPDPVELGRALGSLLVEPASRPGAAATGEEDAAMTGSPKALHTGKTLMSAAAWPLRRAGGGWRSSARRRKR